MSSDKCAPCYCAELKCLCVCVLDLQTDPDSLRRLLAKTQASAAAGGGGAGSSSFPSFSFPKSSSSAYKSVASTDAIFHALLEEEDAGEGQGQGQSGASTARSASRQRLGHGHGGGPGLDDDAAELEREIRSAMNDENELDEEAAEDDDAADSAQYGRDAEEEVPRDPRARMDRLAAQVAAIRARVHDDGDDYAFAPDERADELHAAVASASSSSDRAKRAGHAVPGSRTAAARDRTVSAGTRRRGNSGSSSSSSSSAASLTARPRSDPAGPPGFDLHGLVGGGPASSTGAAGGCDSPPSPAVSSRAHLSLADRLDQAIGVRPSSSSSSSSAAADSWRTWKPRGLAAGGSASAAASAPPPPFGAGLSVSASLDGGDMAGGSASMVRAAARGQQAAAAAAAAGLSSASPRFNGSASPSPRQVVAPVRQGRPLRALSSSGAAASPGSGTALLAAMQMQGSPAASLHSARAAAAAHCAGAPSRPLSASALELQLCVGGGPGSLPPPISSTQAQIKASGSRSRLAQ